MKNVVKKIFNKKVLLGLSVFLVLVAVFFLFSGTDSVLAQEDDSDNSGGGLKNKLIILFGWLIYFLVWTLGKLLVFVIGWLVQVASWDQFVTVPAVEEGWVIIRDLCNMFFILILLVIAFATILRYENYNIKQLLPKVIIAAVLINFSKTICGVAVEFSQIVMLTFVHAFAGSDVNNTGANNLVNLLGMDHMMDFIKKRDEVGGDLGLETVGGIIVAFIAALIAFVVVCAMLAVLLFRLIMIWVYIVLSPLAFLLFAFPHGKAYASRWVSSFSKQLMVGPVLAFFLWLALYTADETSYRLKTEVTESMDINEGIMSGFLSGDVFQAYIITIAFLVGGLVIAQEIGEVSGKAAGKGLAAINKGKAWTSRKMSEGAKRGATVAGKATGRGALGVAQGGTWAASKMALGKSDSLNKLKNFTGQWRSDLKDNRFKEKRDKRLRTLQKMGMGEKSLSNLKELGDTNLGRYSKTAAGLGGALAAGVTTNVLGAAAIATPAIAHGVSTKFKGSADKKEQERKERKQKAKEEKDEKIKQAKEKRDEDYKKRDKSLEDLDRQFKEKKINEDQYNRSKKSINRKFDPKKTESEYKTTKKRAEDEYNSKIKDIDKDAGKSISEKISGGKWSPIKGWHPQKVTMEAAKKGSGELDTADKRKEVLASGEKPQNFAGNSWYSPSGQTSLQKKTLDKIASTEERSKKALDNMVNSLDKLKDQIARDGIDSVSESELGSVESLKKGVAAYQKGGHDEAGNLNNLVQVIDDIPTGRGDKEDHEKTVEDFKDTVIEN